MKPVYIPPVMSHLPHLVLEEQPINAVQQTTDVQLAGAEEGSCEDTKNILVLSFEHLTIIIN